MRRPDPIRTPLVLLSCPPRRIRPSPKVLCGARELDCFKRSSFRRRVGSRIQAGFKRVSFRPPCVVLSGNGQNSGRSIQTQTSCSVRSLSEQRPLRPFYAISILPFAPSAFATLLQGYPEKAVMASCSSIPSIGTEKMWGGNVDTSLLLHCYPTKRFQGLRATKIQGLRALRSPRKAAP